MCGPGLLQPEGFAMKDSRDSAFIALISDFKKNSSPSAVKKVMENKELFSI